MSDSTDRNLSSHIFSASATLVGISLTCLGLFRISDRLKNFSTLANEVLAVDAVAFLAACLLSYFSLRGWPKGRSHVTEMLAERFFLVAISGMVIICGLIAYELF